MPRIDLHQGTRREAHFEFSIRMVRANSRTYGISFATWVELGLRRHLAEERIIHDKQPIDRRDGGARPWTDVCPSSLGYPSE